MEGRETFLNAGGESFNYIPCLNDEDLFVSFLVNQAKNERDPEKYLNPFLNQPLGRGWINPLIFKVCSRFRLGQEKLSAL